MAANNGIRFTIVYRCFLLCSYYFSHPSHRSRNNSKIPRLKNSLLSKVFIFENFSVYANTIERRSKLNLGAELKIDELGDTPRIGRLNGELGPSLLRETEGGGRRKERRQKEGKKKRGKSLEARRIKLQRGTRR